MNGDLNVPATNEPGTPSVKDYYKLLGVEKDASASRIRDVYYRLKTTYNSGNQALYSLIGDEEIQDSMQDIAEAYRILSHSASRMEHDICLIRSGMADKGEFRSDLHHEVSPDKSSRSLGALLSSGTEPPPSSSNSYTYEPAADPFHSLMDGTRLDSRPGASTGRYASATTRKIKAPKATDQDLQERIQALLNEGEPGAGESLLKVRELMDVSKEEMQEHIKISVAYIDAIEASRFEQLPQEVYVKGFVKSFLRYLGVQNYQKFVDSYIERHSLWSQEKDSF